MIDWRKCFVRPEGAVWCDECLRWEVGDGRFPRVTAPRSARVLHALARIVRWPGNKLAEWLTDGAGLVQVEQNIRDGVFCVRTSAEEEKR